MCLEPLSLLLKDSFCCGKLITLRFIVTMREIYHRSITSLKILKNIFWSEGINGLFRGNYTNSLRVAPCCAIEFYSFEINKRWFDQHFGNWRPEFRSIHEKFVGRWTRGLVCLHPYLSNGFGKNFDQCKFNSLESFFLPNDQSHSEKLWNFFAVSGSECDYLCELIRDLCRIRPSNSCVMKNWGAFTTFRQKTTEIPNSKILWMVQCLP